MTIAIAGASGFLGQKLTKRLEGDGHQVVALSRSATGGGHRLHWQPNGSPGSLPRVFETVDAVVNLAGENLAQGRWGTQRKEAILSSRVLATRTLARAVAACAKPPRVFVSGSAVGYYGPRGDELVTEAAGPGSDFLARVCIEWEQEARAAESSVTRVAVVRTGLALARDGGALGTMRLPFKLGLGATLGSGDQYMPWITTDDWTAMVSWLIHTDHASGVFNATAPTPVTNREFTRALGRVLRRPAVLRAPACALRGALGEMSAMLLTGQRAVPAHAEQLGFQFTHHTIEPALKSLGL